MSREEMNEERAPRRGRPSKRETEGRSRRIPLGTPMQKLSVPQAQDDPEHVYRWINDTPGRLQKADLAGYKFVEDPTLQVGEGSDNGNSARDSRVSRLVGRNEKGGEQYAYLMRIKREWYDEDQESKQQAVDEVDESIRYGQFKAGENSYVPKDGIKMRRG